MICRSLVSLLCLCSCLLTDCARAVRNSDALAKKLESPTVLRNASSKSPTLHAENGRQAIVKKFNSNALHAIFEREVNGCLRVQKLIQLGKEAGHPGWRSMCKCEIDRESRAIVVDDCGTPIDKVGDRKYGTSELTSLAFDLLAALDLMQTADNIVHVHHNIKPDSIVVSSSSLDGTTRENLHAMITDWGGSEDTVSVSDPSHMCVHTIQYMPPEVRASPRKCFNNESPWSYDIFSLGVVLERTCENVANALPESSELINLRELAYWMTYAEWNRRPLPISALMTHKYFGERSRLFLLGTWASPSTLRSYHIRRHGSFLMIDVLKDGKHKGSVSIDTCFAGFETCCTVSVQYKSSMMNSGALEVTLCVMSLVRVETFEKAKTSFKPKYILKDRTSFTRWITANTTF